MRTQIASIVLGSVLVLTGCGSSGPARTADGGGSDGGSFDAGAGDAGCFAAGEADHVRRVVVSHPYLDDGGGSGLYEVLELSASGELSATGVEFTMRRASQGHIEFTPDGRLGFVAQEDGTVGVFELFDDGGVTVLDDGLSGFYASELSLSVDGSRAYVLDQDTIANGGGIYSLAVDCSLVIGAPAAVGTFNTPDAISFLHGAPQRALVAGGAALDSASTDDVHLVDFADGGVTPVGHASLFPDHDAIPSAIAITQDDAYALVADDGFVAGNRVGVVHIDAGGLMPVGILSTSNPADVVTSPFGNAALILNSNGTDGLTAVDYDPSDASAPFTLRGSIDYVGPHPQLPSEAVVIRRGSLTGRVLVAELSGVRQVQFERDGGITDLSIVNADGGFDSIVGAMGVQP